MNYTRLFTACLDSILFAALHWFVAVPELAAQSADQYALLPKPTVSKTQIVFSYGDDLWVVDCSGAMPSIP
jgi:hypothetical protein